MGASEEQQLQELERVEARLTTALSKQFGRQLEEALAVCAKEAEAKVAAVAEVGLGERGEDFAPCKTL